MQVLLQFDDDDDNKEEEVKEEDEKEEEKYMICNVLHICNKSQSADGLTTTNFKYKQVGCSL